MVSGFGSLRIIIFSLAVLAQIYLFLHLFHLIRSSRRLKRFKSLATVLAGGAIGVLFAMNWHVTFRPLPWVDPPMAAQTIFFYAPAVWTLGSIFSALLLFLTRAASWILRTFVSAYRRALNREVPRPIDLGRRRFLQSGMSGLAAAPFLLSGYGAAAQDCEIRELTLPFGLPLRGVQLTDIHAGVFMTREKMRRYVDQVIALKPEVFFLTGDYISNSTVFFPGFVEEITRVRTRYGIFATMGNHENWYGEWAYYEAMFRRHGIHLLQNAHREIRTEHGVAAIAGIDDLRSGRPDLKAALRGLDTATPTILLSHRPEIFPRAASVGIPLILSGHYHGGQIKLSLPGGDLSLAHLRTPYPEGLYRKNKSHLYVSRGIGTTFTPVRLNARPEVTLLHLT